MSHRHEHKLDPRLRRHVAARVGKKTGHAQVFIEVANAEALDWVKRAPGVRHFVNVVDGYCTATIRYDRIGKLLDHPGVMEIEAVRFFRPHLDHSVGNIHGWRGIRKKERLQQGAGVVVGIVDYGLDFTLADFQNPGSGTTRIAYLWDQAVVAKRAREKPPRKFAYGVEYSHRQIDMALRAKRQGKDPLKIVRHNARQPFPDIDGHGTHVAGIAAGNGMTAGKNFPAGKFIGVAPGSTLVFVNLNRRATLKQVRGPRGTLANSVHLAHAVAYCFEKADELNLPCVVNLSMGFNGGGHDGNMAVECIIDALLQKSGRALVISAGNEDGVNTRIYSGGRLKLHQRVALGWENGGKIAGGPYDGPATAELEIWYSRRSKLKVRLGAPGDAEKSRAIAPGQSATIQFKKGEKATISSDQMTPWHGAARIHIELSKGRRETGIRFGTWKVELEATNVAAEEARRGVRYDAWIERTTPDAATQGSRFAAYNENKSITLTTPSTARRVITVASCLNRHEKSAPIADSSGRGPTRDGRSKPELTAPGESVISTNAGAGQRDGDGRRPARVRMHGTSMSAPHVTGVVARLLSRQRFLTAEEIREILVDSAIQPASGAAWDAKSGYGKADAERAAQLLDKLLGS